MARNSFVLKVVFWALAGQVFGLKTGELVFSQAENPQFEQNEARGNPFLTRKEEKALAKLGNAIPLDYLKVSAIFYSSISSQSRAIINGKVLVQGDSIDNKEIIKINSEEVLLKDSQGNYVAKITGLMDKASQ